MPIIEYKLNGDSSDLVTAIAEAEGGLKKATIAAGALAAGTLALGSAFAALIEETTQVVDEVSTVARATGLTTDQVNGLRLAAKATGKELADIVPKDLSKNLFDASVSGGDMATIFAELGIEVENADGSVRDASAAFPELIEQLTQMESATEAAAIAEKLMGGEGRELLSAFSNVDDLEKFVDLGRQFGTDVGPGAQKAAADWQQATSNLQLALEDAGATLLDTLGGSGAFARTIEQFSLGFVYITRSLGAFVTDFAANVSGLGSVISNVLTGNFDEAAEAAQGLKLGTDVISDSLAAGAEAAEAFWQVQTREAPKVAEAIGNNGSGSIGGALREAAEQGKSLNEVWQETTDIAANLADIQAAANDDQLNDLIRLENAAEKQLLAIGEQRQALFVLGQTGADVSLALTEASEAEAAIRQRLARDTSAAVTEAAEIRREAELKTLEEIREAETEAAEQRQEAIEAEFERFLEIQELKKEAGAIVADALIETATAATELFLDNAAQEGAALREKLDRINESIAATEAEGGTATAAQQAKVKAIKEELKERRKAVKTAFALNQSAAVSSIAVDAARSILSLVPAFAFLGPGAPVAAAAVVTPLAAIQAAAVLGQDPPSVHDGTANVDEVLATLRSGEAVANQRGAESLGRDNIEAANRGEPFGTPPIQQIVFQTRVLDQMMATTIETGGRTQRLLAADRPPASTADPFGGI